MSELRKKYVERHLKAERKDPLAYDADLDDLAAYRLLVHAEIEDYLETKAKEGLSAIECALNSGQISVRDNHALIVIAIFLGHQLCLDQAKWRESCNACIKLAREKISKNNGIKNESFRLLSILSGKMPDEIDSGLAASLTSYGVDRGDVAHRSSRHVQTIKAPSAEVNTAESIVQDLARYFS